MDPILVIGGGNTERVLTPKHDVVKGNKNVVDSEYLFGGSGVNYSSRLLAMSKPVVPLLDVGDDRNGRDIQSFVAKIALKSGASKGILDYISSAAFFVGSGTTADAVILVQDGVSTTFTCRHDEADQFSDTITSRMHQVEHHFGKGFSGILVGHLNSRGDEDCASVSDATTVIVERFFGRTPIFVNFGMRQIARGFNFWKPLLQKIDILQMNILEARTFIGPVVGSDRLADILDFIRTQNVTFVITLDKFGAVAVVKEKCGDSSFILVPEYIYDERMIRDPTGAGDAFMAGVVSYWTTEAAHLPKGASVGFNSENIIEALDHGRKWAAFACTTIGGASQPPNEVTLLQFLAKPQFDKAQPVAFHSRASSEQFLRAIDKACRP